MFMKHFAVGALALSAAVFAASAHAGGADKDGGFYATPIQHGAPRDLPGERLVPGANLAVDVIDGIARPLVVDPIQTAGAALPDPFAEPAAAAGTAPKGARHHRGHKHAHLSGHHHGHAHAHGHAHKKHH